MSPIADGLFSAFVGKPFLDANCLLRKLQAHELTVGKLSTGDSLGMSPQDEASILVNDATLKDMEGAAVAYVAYSLSVLAIFVKAFTGIVDG